MLITTENVEGVFYIKLHAPPANCYSYEMMQELDQAILRARMDDLAHVIVLTGEGSKFFCAGADISMLSEVAPSFKYNFCLHANETLMRFEQTNKLVICAINGHCVGGGLEVALACDLRVARQGCGKIGLPEVKLGVLPGTGGTARLTRLAGKSKALELMTEATMMDPDEACRMGIINRVVDCADNQAFMKWVQQYARKFCPPNAASAAIGNIKRSVQSGADMGMTEHLALERELQQQLFVSQDAKEGIRAYVEKRPATFIGM